MSLLKRDDRVDYFVDSLCDILDDCAVALVHLLVDLDHTLPCFLDPLNKFSVARIELLPD